MAVPVQDDVYTFCECYYIQRALKIVSQAPAPIRRALDGYRIVPTKPYREFPPADFARLSILPGAIPAAHGFSKKLQKLAIATLQKNPIKGHAFYGPTGVGKSFLMWAQAQEAAYAGLRVIFRTAAQYVEGMRLSQTSEEIHPMGIVLPDELQKRHTFLFIDEMDNISTTEFSLRKMFELADCCWQSTPNLRLSFASNLDEEALRIKLGPATMRRFNETVSAKMILADEESSHE